MQLFIALNWIVTVGAVLFIALWGLRLGMPAISLALLHLVTNFEPTRIILYVVGLTVFIVLLSYRLQAL